MKDLTRLDELKSVIQHNCDISDTNGASIFSICGMALRLRDLNKWEQGLHPWEEAEPASLLAWIDNKEQIWETLSEKPFNRLPLNGHMFDPFDTPAVNQALKPFGLFYGAGYAHSLKPTFFLAEIEEQTQINSIPVITLGKEMVRDLLTIPALNQDDTVIFRKDAARLFLWDQIAYLKKSGQRFLKLALRHCGLPDTGIDSRIKFFGNILKAQETTYIHHEIGELTDNVFNRDLFRTLVSSFPHSPVELMARTVKDLLADTCTSGTLSQIIATRDHAALGFYAAFQDGLFRPMFPELRRAVERFVSDKDWDGIEDARQTGFNTAKKYVGQISDIYEKARDPNDMGAVSQEINERLVTPLTDTRN
ncbi:MAG: hypothetical protein MI892_12975 [Desulfobacterales bacterium]|nr:hypothetical protein [Desulfobacterales bacterium]